MLTLILVLTLFFIAVVVATGLAKRRNMWKWIIAYWVVLALKNFADFCLEVMS